MNEIFRTYKKLIFLVLIIGGCVIFWFFTGRRNKEAEIASQTWERQPYENGGYGYQFATDQLSGEVTFGIKGYTVKEKRIPVELTMRTNKGDFSGFIKLIVPGNNGGGIGYQAAIECSAGQDTHLLTTVPQLGSAAYFCFEIIDQYGNTVLSKIEVPEYSEWVEEDNETQGQVCLGVFSDTPEAFEQMKGLTIDTDGGEMSVRMIHLDEKSFPRSVNSLDILSGIIIDNYSISKLSEQQKNILLSWVKSGGHLIMGTGEYAEKVLDGFQNEFKLETGNIETQRIYFAKYVDFSGETTVYLSQLHFEENAGWKMVNWSEPASFYEKNYGTGLVQIMRFSLTDGSILQWNRFNEMAKSLLERLLGSVFENSNDEENGLWNMEMALHDFNRSQTPNAFYYGIFFIVYLCALTFISYFLLRRMQKLEYIWAVVPALAIFFTGCILVRSRGISSQTQSSLSAIRIVDDSEVKNDVYFLYQNAEGESRELKLISAVDTVEPMDYEYRLETVDDALFRRIQENYLIGHTNRGYNVLFSEASPGTMRLLKMSENKSMNYGEKNVVFDTDFVTDYTSFAGEITNQCDRTFDKFVVIRGNEYWDCQDFEAGDTVTIKKEDIRCWDQIDDIGEIFSREEDNVVTLDILNYLQYRYLKNNTDLSDIILIGITLDDKFQLLREGESVGNQVSVYVNHIKADTPEKGDNAVNINQEYLKNNMTPEELKAQLMEKRSLEVLYQFETNKIPWVIARNQDDYPGKIYAYNYETNEKEEILSSTHEVMEYEELRKYLSAYNELKITYEQAENMEEYSMPVMSVWLKKAVQ